MGEKKFTEEVLKNKENGPTCSQPCLIDFCGHHNPSSSSSLSSPYRHTARTFSERLWMSEERHGVSGGIQLVVCDPNTEGLPERLRRKTYCGLGKHSERLRPVSHSSVSEG